MQQNEIHTSVSIFVAALYLHPILEGKHRTAGGHDEYHRGKGIVEAEEIRAERRRKWTGKHTGTQRDMERRRMSEGPDDYIRNPNGAEEGNTCCTAAAVLYCIEVALRESADGS